MNSTAKKTSCNNRVMMGCQTPVADGSCIWRNAVEPRLRVDAEVHIWGAHLDSDASSVEPLVSLLSPEEKVRADKFRFSIHRNRFIVRRSILRRILAKYLLIEPQAVEFQHGEFGKPRLYAPRSADLEFNATHSDEASLIVLTRSKYVGVDLERIRPLSDLELLVADCLCPLERNRLDGLPTNERLEQFYRYWTCKEAYLKALGTGLSRRLDSIQVSIDDIGMDSEAKVIDAQGDSLNWSVWSFTPFAGYVAAVATAPACSQRKWFMM